MKTLILIFCLSLIITGCSNSIFTKYQDIQYVSPGKQFEQPVFQTLQMFIGESAAFIFVGLQKWQSSSTNRVDYSSLNNGGKPQIPNSKKYILSIPAICDIVGTTLMQYGLILCPVSIYQMIRGALLIFVALFSILFLKRVISRIEWLSLFIVIFGIAIVGLSSGHDSGEDTDQVHQQTDNDTSKTTFGIIIILLAQVFTATQFVVEEHIVGKWTIEPLQLVGYEGVFGGGITLIGMILFYPFIGINTQGPFDIVNTWKEFTSSNVIIYTSVLIMISIGLFNFFGITLTSKLSATARSTIDTCRTLLVWLVSLYLGWESFKWLQLLGFVFLVFGTLVFNGALIIDDFLPSWFSADKEKIKIVDTIDEQIERL